MSDGFCLLIQLERSELSVMSRTSRFLLLRLVSQKLYTVINHLHAVSRTQQGRQREPGVETLRSPPSTEFCRHFESLF